MRVKGNGFYYLEQIDINWIANKMCRAFCLCNQTTLLDRKKPCLYEEH